MTPKTDQTDISVSILKFPESIEHWPLVMKFLQLRKEVFVDKMSWPLQHDEQREFEQYDSITSVYLIAHKGDEVLGGARLVRTDQRQSVGRVVYTYMIRDAYMDRLPGLPAEICTDEPPVDKTVWELTRFASIDNKLVGRAVIKRGLSFLREQHASKCLFLGPPAFMRMARSMGYPATPLGKIVGNRDGRFLAFSCDID